MKANASPSKVRQEHTWNRARALGYEAAESGAPNPYASKTQCWIEFNIGRNKGLEARQQTTTK